MRTALGGKAGTCAGGVLLWPSPKAVAARTVTDNPIFKNHPTVAKYHPAAILTTTNVQPTVALRNFAVASRPFTIMQRPDPDDAELVAQLQAGEEDAFEKLLARYRRPIINFAYRLLGNAADADDVAQEVFVRFYRNIHTYRPRAKFSTWLFALARNACLDRLRYRQRHPTEPLNSAPEPASYTQYDDVGEHIAAAIAELPEDQRTAIALAEYHDLSYAEIAAIMRCSEKSVEARLYRAKQTLRQKLKTLLG
jgi:RNA polymerase sigma-70 factor (ECF subfamily)